MSTTRPPFPPFDLQTAVQKVQAAEDAWNTCDPVTVALAYTADSVWRNRDQFVTGRAPHRLDRSQRHRLHLTQKFDERFWT